MQKPIIGIVGNGVVGSAIAAAYQLDDYHVRIYDCEANSAVDTLGEVMVSGIVFLCLPEKAVELFIRDIVHPSYKHTTIVLKSTVPVGTTRMLTEKYKLKGLVHSPEFLNSKTAIVDACNPERLIIGEPTPNTYLPTAELDDLYDSRFPNVPRIIVSSDESELIKLLDNAFGAAKVSLFNEFYSIADTYQVDWRKILTGLLMGGRINKLYTQVPGYDGKYGWGGDCWPKDLHTLTDNLKSTGFEPALLNAVISANKKDRQQNDD